MHWSALETVAEQFADDGDAVRPVERNGGQVEDGRNRRIRAKADQIDQDTAEAEEPDRVKGRIRERADFVPDPRSRQHLVSRISPDSARASLDSGNSGEIQHDECRYRKEDTATSPNDVVEDLRYRLLHW